MLETDQQRAIRREASQWLTAVINAGAFNSGLGTAIRGIVVDTLSNIYNRLTLINLELKEKYAVRPDRTLIRFYMKGGNAFDCVANPGGPEANHYGGGKSDWDTQVVIDPWAPLPLQNAVYGLAEDIVIDEFRQAAERIAIREFEYTLFMVPLGAPVPIGIPPAAGHQNPVGAPDPGGNIPDFPDNVNYLWTYPQPVVPPPAPPLPPIPPPLAPPPPPANAGIYKLEYDEIQSIRRIYNRDDLGLWTDTRQRLSARGIDKRKWMPGMIFNAAIKPFDLYRLGYTWHMTTDINGFPAIAKPLLMELIDVTIPRRNTIEAVSVWEELEQQHIQLTDVPIAVDVHLPDNTIDGVIQRDLPLPDIYYHVRELLTMVSEVADGRSHHVDKVMRRFRRFHQIWGAFPVVNITTIMAEFIGRPIAGLLPPPVGSRVHTAIITYATAAELALTGLPAPPPGPGAPPLPAPAPAYVNLAAMMYAVEQQTTALQAIPLYTPNGLPTPEAVAAFQLARNQLNAAPYLAWLSASFSPAGAIVPLAGLYAYADDLVLLDTLLENGYLAANNVRVSGVDQSIVVRTTNHDQLEMVSGRFLNRFATLAPAAPATANLTVRHKQFQTTRANSITTEAVFVVFNANQPVACITLTTASAQELPFLTNPVAGGGTTPRCPPGELARQRKMMAALIDNYVIKTSLSLQYDMLQEIITP